MKKSALLPAVLAAFVSLQAFAAEPAGTLKKIRDAGSISLGYREDSMPFSYLDGKGNVVGYSHEIMLKVAEAIKKELGLPRLDINLMPITSQNRIPLMLNRTIDLECGSTTNNSERQKQVAFSNTLFVIGTRLMTRRDAGIKDFRDLDGRNVVTIAGTTSEKLLHKLKEEKKIRMKIVTTVDHGPSPLTLLQTGQADAYMMDDALLYAVIAEAWRPQDWIVNGTPQSYEAYGCMMRKDDAAFKQVVDRTIAQIMTSGEAGKLYRKWFMSPIPPKGINLNFPMSEHVTRLYGNPNDKAFDQGGQ
jgi:glutamate/aspartate transport system substrate-binding protein